MSAQGCRAIRAFILRQDTTHIGCGDGRNSSGRTARRKSKAEPPHKLDSLPDGAMISLDGQAFAVRGSRLWLWAPDRYLQSRSRPHAIVVDVLTPQSIVTVLGRGYVPLWHASITR